MRKTISYFDEPTDFSLVQGGPLFQLLLRAGLQPGMIVTHVGRTAVNTPKEFRAAVENISGPVVLRIADDKKNPTRTGEPSI